MLSKYSLKKSLGTAIGAAASLGIVSQAFAQTSLDPCLNMTPPWDSLCDISTADLPTVISNTILVIFIVAALVALFFLIWGGIKWVMSGGDKAKVEVARSTIIAALIGLVVTFLSFFILQLILGLFGLSLTNLVIPQIIP